MKTTKEKILLTSLNLFSKYGFDGVSIYDIATELDITKGALYRHFESKEAIFNEIIKRVVDKDRSTAKDNNLPLEKEGEYYVSSLDDLIDFTIDQFTYFSIDDFGSSFRRMVTLEQFRNLEMIELYRNIFLNGPIEYTVKVFASLIKERRLKDYDTQELAIEFYSPFFTLLSLSDHSKDKVKLVDNLKEELLKFKERYEVK